MLSAGGGGFSRGKAGGIEPNLISPRPVMALASAAAGFGASGLLGSGGGTFRAGSGGLGSSSTMGAGGLLGRLGGAGSGSESNSGDGSSCPPPSPKSM